MSNWKPVVDRPKESMHVLATINYNNEIIVDKLYYNKNIDMFIFKIKMMDNPINYNDRVIYWMPIPEPYKFK